MATRMAIVLMDNTVNILNATDCRLQNELNELNGKFHVM